MRILQEFHKTSLPCGLGCLLLLFVSSALSEVEIDTTALKAEACVAGGMLSGEIFGAIEGELRWDVATELSCDGMPRPAGRGARLRFAGPHPISDGTLAIIIAMPALLAGHGGVEIESRVTVIEEGDGRFFSTRETPNCWTDLVRLQVSNAELDVVSGTLYCIGPLAEINGDDAVVLGDLNFQGFIDWSKS